MHGDQGEGRATDLVIFTPKPCGTCGGTGDAWQFGALGQGLGVWIEQHCCSFFFFFWEQLEVEFPDSGKDLGSNWRLQIRRCVSVTEAVVYGAETELVGGARRPELAVFRGFDISRLGAEKIRDVGLLCGSIGDAKIQSTSSLRDLNVRLAGR